MKKNSFTAESRQMNLLVVDEATLAQAVEDIHKASVFSELKRMLMVRSSNKQLKGIAVVRLGRHHVSTFSFLGRCVFFFNNYICVESNYIH